MLIKYTNMTGAFFNTHDHLSQYYIDQIEKIGLGAVINNVIYDETSERITTSYRVQLIRILTNYNKNELFDPLSNIKAD